MANARCRFGYVQVGIFGKPITVPFDTVLFHELLVNSGNATTPSSWRRAMLLLEADLVQLDPLVTEVIPLGEWERALAATRDGVGMKIVIDPRAGSASGDERKDRS